MQLVLEMMDCKWCAVSFADASAVYGCKPGSFLSSADVRRCCHLVERVEVERDSNALTQFTGSWCV